ncbi:cobalt ECF transporter T component CbiQ [Bacillus tuaregi]|uniref:cobalt ECF transporter T component CbiQ n=1 Tax=Bacillus tuaregi TaxID=1816695 RepID=UPI0008F94406|nr:cobalt ECF transporter T component CbiQ [Bacillus tuaregi]
MLLIDKYAYFNRLKHIHPVEKVTLALSLLFFSLAVKNNHVSIATFFIMSGLIIFGARISISYYAKLLLLPSFFLCSGIVTILISFASIDTAIHNELWSFSIGEWKLFISQDNSTKAIQLLFVTFSSISCLYFLILTTSVHDLMQVLQKLKLPKLLIEMMEITYRFIFVFLDTALQIYQAQNARLGYRTGKRWLYSISLLASSLLMAVFKRSKELTNALESRAYADDFAYIDNRYQLSAVNWLIILAVLAALFFISIL